MIDRIIDGRADVPCPWVPPRGGMPARRRQRRRWRRLAKPERDLLRTAVEVGVMLDVKELQRAASRRESHGAKGGCDGARAR